MVANSKVAAGIGSSGTRVGTTVPLQVVYVQGPPQGVFIVWQRCYGLEENMWC